MALNAVDRDDVRRIIRGELNSLQQKGILPMSALRVPRCKVTLAGDLVLMNSTPTTLLWNGTEVFDVFAMHNPLTNADRIVAPDGGNYLVACSVIFDPGAAGSRHIHLLHNGVVRGKFSTDVVSLVDFGVLAVATFEARKGDFFQAQAINQSGTNETIRGGVPGVASWFSAVKLA